MATNPPLMKSFSRRAFFAGAGSVVTAFAAPLVTGQRVADAEPSPLDALAPEEALAEEPKDPESFEFDVASPSMLALKVVDVSKEDKPGVKGATVFVESRSVKDKSFTHKTNDQGMVLVDLTNLAEKPKGTDPTYRCNVAVTVRAEGYRQVNIDKTHLDAGCGVGLPTCPVVDGVPYFRKVSFNGFDIQYRLATFAYSSGNDDTHNLEAELYLKGVGEAEVSFWRWRASSDVFPGFDSSELTCLGTCDASLSASEVKKRQAADEKDAQAIAKGDGYDKSAHDDRWVRSVSLSERFLQTAFERGLREGDRIVVRVQTGGESTAYLMSARFKPALISDCGTSTYDALPGLTNNGLSFTCPKCWPYIGGGKVSIWTPSLAFMFSYDPMGYFMLGFAPPLAEVDFDTKEWTRTEYESFKDQRKKAHKKSLERRDSLKKMYNNWKDGDANGDTRRAQCKIFSKFEVGVAAQFFADLNFDWGGTAKGALNFVFALSGEASFDFNIMLLCVPLYLTLKPSAELGLNLRAAIETTWPSGDESFDEKVDRAFSEINFAWSESQVAIVVAIGFEVGLGVGVAGFASLGFRGSANITMYLGLADGSAHGVENWKWPHARVGAGLDLSVCAQVWLIKYSKKIWGESWPTLCDSWKNYADASSLGEAESYATACGLPGEFAIAGAGNAGFDDEELPADDDGNVTISFEELERNGVKVTDDELVNAGEFKATTSAKAAGLDDADDRVLVAVPLSADEDGVEAYSFRLVSEGGEEDQLFSDSGDASAAAVATDGGAGASSGDAAAADTAAADASTADAAAAVAVTAAVASAEADADDDTAAVASSSGSDDIWAGLVDENGDPIDFADADEDGDFDYDFDDVPSHEPEPGEVGPNAETAGVASIEGDGVLRPSIDRMILKGVFSNGRVRSVKVGASGRQVLLRIASGTYNGQARTRLIAQVRYRRSPNDPTILWSSPRPIDFRVKNLGDLTRDQLFDYDFDVCEDAGEVYLILLSGTRPDGEDTSLVNTCTNPVTTVIKLGMVEPGPATSGSQPRVISNGSVSWRSFDGGASLGEGDERYLTYAPTISANSIQFGSMPSDRLVYITGGLLYKRAPVSEILSSDTPTHAAAFVFRCFVHYSSLDVANTLTYTVPGTPDDISGIMSVRTSFERDASGKETVEFAVGFESPTRSGLVRQRTYYTTDAAGKPSFHHAITQVPSLPNVKKFYREGLDAEKFLAVDADGVVCEVRMDNGSLAPITPYEVQTAEDGSEEIVPCAAASFIVTADRQFLIYADNKRGIDGFEYDDGDQEAEPEATYEDGRYRIMACRAVTAGGIRLYSKPFVLCQVDHAIDEIAAATVSGSKILIVASAIVNLNESKSNYYEIEAPVVAALTAMSMVSPTDVLFPGEPTPMEITLRNDGNTQVAAAKLSIVDENNAVVMPATEVAFGPDTIVSTPEAKPNPNKPTDDPVFSSGYHNVTRGRARAAAAPFDDAAFQAHPLVVDDGLRFLKPGCEATIKQDVTIPADATGKKKLRVVVSDVKFSNPACASAASWDEMDEAWAGAAAVTADCDESGVANIAAVGDEALGELAGAFLEKTAVDVSVCETGSGADSLALLRSGAVNAMTEGGHVDPTDPDDPGDEPGGGGGNGGGGNGNGKKRLPNTGDASVLGGALGVVGAFAALAGAGFAAYSARRSEIEAEEEASRGE